MDDSVSIPIEVAYARPDIQVIISERVEKGTNIEQAICLSGILEQFTEIDLKKNQVGIFGQLSNLGYVLRANDRIEIYRALIADPKESRRKRAHKKK